jgi:hypothetical protein
MKRQRLSNFGLFVIQKMMQSFQIKEKGRPKGTVPYGTK